MWVMPDSTASRRTARAWSRSRGGPKTPGPASCMAPKPMRLRTRSSASLRVPPGAWRVPPETWPTPGTLLAMFKKSISNVAVVVLTLAQMIIQPQRCSWLAVELPNGVGYRGDAPAPEGSGGGRVRRARAGRHDHGPHRRTGRDQQGAPVQVLRRQAGAVRDRAHRRAPQARRLGGTGPVRLRGDRRVRRAHL